MPHKLNTVLSELDELIICEVRKTAKIGIDELSDILKPFIPHINRYNVYRCLKRHGLSQLKVLIEEEREIQKTYKPFKAYEPGYVHVDVKKIPKLKGETEKNYLFVSIDRATRLVYIGLKTHKSAQSSVEFLKEINAFYPYPITKLLTDNGKEFTDRFIKGRKEPSGNHPFDVECKNHQIEHRLTRPYTPKTNLWWNALMAGLLRF